MQQPKNELSAADAQSRLSAGLGVLRINMLGFFKKLTKKLEGDWIDKDPVRHYFPDMGSDGEITIDCVITPSPGANRNMPTGNEEFYDWREGVASKCVGALVVEVDEYGLRLRWKSGKLGEDGFLSPFAPAPGMKPPAKPAEERGNDGNVKPLERAEVDVQAKIPNVKLRGTPMVKPEQRATLDETHDLAMPRQGVSLLNVMLDLGRTPHKTHTRPKTLDDNVICWMMPVKRYP